MPTQNTGKITEVDRSQPLLHQHGYEIQQYGTLRELPIVLNPNDRSESCTLVNQILADTIILYHLYKKHHWLIRGHTFYQLHLLLDKHASEQIELIDALGERVQTLGGVAIAEPRHVAEVTKIKRPPNGVEEVPVMLSRLLEAHELIIGELRVAIDKTAANQDSGTNDLLMSKALRTHETQVWFLAEHLVDTPLVQASFDYSGTHINRSKLMTQSFWLFGNRLTILADHTTTNGQYDLIEGYNPPGTMTPLHRHTRYSEQLYVLEGELTVWAGENKVVLTPGESFLISPGIPHVVGVLSDKPARALVVSAPSSFARLIAATGTLDETEPADLALFERISIEIGDELLGPPGTLPTGCNENVAILAE